MAEVHPFRGLRYNTAKVGELSNVIAPPYDVISPEFQDALYAKHPNNIIRLILNKILPDDSEANNRYIRAAEFFRKWKQDGVLVPEATPAIYVYHQEFEVNGKKYVRKGFMARLRVSPFGEGVVFPHEQTIAGPKADRLMLFSVTKANLSQVFGLFPDAQNEVNQLLDAAIAGAPSVEATDHLDVVHRMWPVTDEKTCTQLAGLMGPKPIFIADGHHRYETACNYAAQQRDAGRDANHPSQFVMMMFIAMDDDGLIVLPTHRLFRQVPDLTAEELTEKLGNYFECRDGGTGAEMAREVWEEIEVTEDQGLIGLYTRKDRHWTLAQLTDAGRAKFAEVAPEHGEEWRELGVAILHRFICGEIFGREPSKESTKYVHLVDEVVAEIPSDEFPMAALVMPATVHDIHDISLAGERMPAKSTYFYPKLLTGLVINPLE
ncbi:MAG: DUF1015 domain-containing protein [Thermoguttaceae bacterium]|nr:DUF1015 domain-containing protein [Thermoguttaceae bacterium]